MAIPPQGAADPAPFDRNSILEGIPLEDAPPIWKQLGVRDEAVNFNLYCAKFQQFVGSKPLEQLENIAIKITGAYLTLNRSFRKIKATFSPSEEIDPSLLHLLTLQERVDTLFNKATVLFNWESPRLKSVEKLLASTNDSIIPISVYYDGRGDVFIVGKHAKLERELIRNATASFGNVLVPPQELSWEQGIPLTLIADNLWEGYLVVKEGEEPVYKFTAADQHWSTGDNYTLGKKLHIDHTPVFASTPNNSSLLIPISVGEKNRLVMCGEGEITVKGKKVLLNWENSIDLIQLRPNLWVLPVEIEKDVSFKLCVITESGEKVWEKGKNRTLSAGLEIRIEPEFEKELDSKEYGLTFLPQIMDAQQQVIERKKASKQANYALHRDPRTRGRPTGVTHENYFFSHKEIVKVIDDFEESGFAGDIPFFRTINGKTVLMQGPTGCSAGVTAMLVLDNGGTIDHIPLETREAGTLQKMVDDITGSGLTPVVTKLQYKDKKSTAKDLQEILSKNGPFIAKVKQKVTDQVGHVVVVDEIDTINSNVRFRDPWHAWEIIVKLDPFMQIIENFYPIVSTLQVDQRKLVSK